MPQLPQMHHYVERELTDMGSLVHGRAMSWLRASAMSGRSSSCSPPIAARVLPSPIEGMRMMMSMLLCFGFSVEEVQTMTAINPARMIGLD